MYHVQGRDSDDRILWLSTRKNWVPDKRHAAQLRLPEAEAEIKTILIRNMNAESHEKIVPLLYRIAR